MCVHAKFILLLILLLLLFCVPVHDTYVGVVMSDNDSMSTCLSHFFVVDDVLCVLPDSQGYMDRVWTVDKIGSHIAIEDVCQGDTVIISTKLANSVVEYVVCFVKAFCFKIRLPASRKWLLDDCTERLLNLMKGVVCDIRVCNAYVVRSGDVVMIHLIQDYMADHAVVMTNTWC